MASAWQTVRVLISSTFRDMHAERDHLAVVEKVTEFSCVYVETKELPKTPGRFPIYVVRRRSK